MMVLIFVTAQAVAPSAATAHSPQLQNRAELFVAADYPKAAKKETGIVSVAVAVGADGTATGCQVTESSGNPALDAQTCAVLQQRGRFAPAQDAKGAAIAGEFRFATAWAGPKAGADMAQVTQELKLTVATMPKDYKTGIKATVTFDAAGKGTACEVVGSSGDVAADEAVCTYLKTRTIPAPKAGPGPVTAVRYFDAAMSVAAAAAPAG